jgi:hypothetical protein
LFYISRCTAQRAAARMVILGAIRSAASSASGDKNPDPRPLPL